MTHALMPIARFPRIAVLLLVAIAAPSVAARAADLSAEEKKIICAGRPTCQIITVTDAGKGLDGVPLRVADIVLGLQDIPNYFPQEGCRSTEAALETMDKMDGGREIWVLAGTARPVKLLPLCNDGYGSAMMGYDEITIADNQLTHTQSGGSAWRWSAATTFQLWPLALISETDCSYHNAAPNTGELTVVDRRTLAARAYAPAPRADWTDAEIGCPAVDADLSKPLQPQPAPDVVAAYPVPVPFDVDASPLADGTTLGTCGLSLRSDGSNGFIIFGKPAAAEDAAEVRIIGESSKSLLIQVRDPLAAAAQKAAAGLSWIKAPHVEIWTAAEGELFDGDAAQGPERGYMQIGVGLDGKVNAGAGKPEALPKVTTWPGKDEQGRDVTVLRVTWDDDGATVYGLGVVYSQAAGGKQLRLVSSAPIQKNKPLFLPSMWHNSQDESGAPGGMCEFSGDSHQLDL